MTKIALIALDAFEISLARHGIEEGWLPNLRDLAVEGRSLTLTHPMPELPGSAWPTTIFGSEPTEHGMLFDRQLDPGTYRIVDFFSESVTREPFWRVLSDVGIRSTLCSVYGNRIIPDFNGTQVVAWGSYDPFSAKLLGPRAAPPDALRLLESAVPRRRSGFLATMPLRDREYRLYLKTELEQVTLQTQGLELLMRETEWDFFFGSYPQPHEGGHLLWHRQEDLIEIYKAIDRDVARLRSACPDDTTFICMTPHGMGPMLQAVAALETVFEKAGWLVRAPSVRRGKQKVADLARRVYRSLPYELRVEVGRRRSSKMWEARDPYAGVDWSRTKVFLLPHDGTSFIRFNLKGREPRGIVDPQDYESLIDEVADAMTQIVDPVTGQPLVRGTVRMDSLLGGPVSGPFPDVIVLWERVRAEGLHLPGLGETGPPRRDPRSGDHPPLGYVIAAGPHTAPGGDLFGGPQAHLPDLAATILDAFGCALPPGITGSPIKGLLG